MEVNKKKIEKVKMQAVQIYFNIVFSILLKLKKYTHTLKKIIDWAFFHRRVENFYFSVFEY